MRKIIVRADDLGYSRGTNYGIADSVSHGLIQSVGVMTNMPDVEHGLALLPKSICLGLHTNICAGKPLCDPAEIPSLVQENGEFKPSKAYWSSPADFVDLEEVVREIEAQYERFIQLTGRKPDYFEGHAVASAHFYKGLEIVARRHCCDYLGPGPDGTIIFKNTPVAMEMGSMDPRYEPDAFLKSLVRKNYPEGTVPVMVCHPGYLDETILSHSSMSTPRPKEAAMAADPHLQQWLKEQGVQAVSFKDLD